MKKLIIQIPCFNEEATIGITLDALPREVSGYDTVEWLIIDDGCTDRTVQVARDHGADHVVSLRNNRGLARGFMAGIEACLKLGADTIVNTDADNQYNADDIPALVRPIVEARADMVIGERPISDIEHFSRTKKFLQKFGSYVVRIASRTNVPDSPSGFRAIHRDAALRLNVFNDYTYTLETIIQAGRKNMRVETVPVRVNGELRESRLVKNIANYVQRSMLTIFRIFLVYKPFKAFVLLSLPLFAVGLILGIRFIYYYLMGAGDGMIQSLLLAVTLIISGFLCVAVAILADLQAVNRTLLEDIRTRLLSLDVDEKVGSDRPDGP